jgi:hypothetical protein
MGADMLPDGILQGILLQNEMVSSCLAFDPEKLIVTSQAVASELCMHICCFCARPYNLSTSSTLEDPEAMVTFRFVRFWMKASRAVNVSIGTPRPVGVGPSVRLMRSGILA